MTPYSHLTLAELIRLHRYDVQGDPLMEELWLRLEAIAAAPAVPAITTAPGTLL